MTTKTAIAKTELAVPDIRAIAPEIIASLVLNGDISKLSPTEKVQYYNGLCKSLGLNPLTQPFKITKLNNKEVLYAGKDCTEQLRRIYGIGVIESQSEQSNGLYIVTVKVQDKTGRFDIAKGAVSVINLSGENLANAIMKAETKAKRRATLSISGLGMLDETEMETVPYQDISLTKPSEEIDESEIEAICNVIAGCETKDRLRAYFLGLDIKYQNNAKIAAAKEEAKKSFENIK